MYLKLVDTRAFLFYVVNRIIQIPNNAVVRLLNTSGILLVKLLNKIFCSTANRLIVVCVHHNIAIQSANLIVLR